MPAELFADGDADLELIESSIPDDYSEIDEMAAGSPVINLVNSLIQRAVSSGASDIHIEPFRTLSRVRLRIDGMLYEIMTPRTNCTPRSSRGSRSWRISTLPSAACRRTAASRSRPRGARSISGSRALPGLFGEKVVLRVLDKNQAILDLDKLGMSEQHLDRYRQLLERGYGLILVTGRPAAARRRRSTRRSII